MVRVFDGDQSDIFSLQDQITVRIANSISRHLVVVAARETQKKVTSPTVTDLLMRGIAIAETTQTKPNLIQQAEFFHKAALLDPSNVEAHARLARAMALLPWQFGTLLTKEEFNADIKEASDEADKAIAIDPDYALSYVGKGLALLASGDPVSAKRFFKKGHSLDRTISTCYTISARLRFIGEFEDAISYSEQALRLDPRSSQIVVPYVIIGTANVFLRRPEAAISWLQKARDVNPKVPRVLSNLAVAYAMNGSAELAHSAVVELLKYAPKYTLQKSPEFPKLGSPDGYRSVYQQVYLPAAQKAGLPRS